MKKGLSVLIAVLLILCGTLSVFAQSKTKPTVAPVIPPVVVPTIAPPVIPPVVVPTIAPPIIPPVVVPTIAPPIIPPVVAPTVAIPVAPPVIPPAVVEKNYTENFTSGVGSRGWVTNNIIGNPDGQYVTPGKNRISFNLPQIQSTWAMLLNPNWQFENVRVEATFENVRSYDASYSLICRWTVDGWYEFRISISGPEAGSYKVEKYDQFLRDQNKRAYVLLHPGMDRYFSKDIKLGQNIKNKLAMECNGDNIRIFINGFEQMPLKLDYIRDYSYQDGAVGVGVQSSGKGLVDVDVHEVKASDLD